MEYCLQKNQKVNVAIFFQFFAKAEKKGNSLRDI